MAKGKSIDVAALAAQTVVTAPAEAETTTELPVGGEAEAKSSEGEVLPKEGDTLTDQLQTVVESATEGERNIEEDVDLDALAESGPLGEAVVAQVLTPASSPESLAAEVGAALQQDVQAVADAIDEASPDTLSLSAFKDAINQYLKDFKPGVAQVPSTAAQAQLRLVRRIKEMPQRLGSKFDVGMAWLLSVILEGETTKTAFHADYVFRFYNEPRIRNAPKDRDEGLFLIAFLKTMADPSTREMARAGVDVQRILNIFESEDSRRKIQNFFKLK